MKRVIDGYDLKAWILIKMAEAAEKSQKEDYQNLQFMVKKLEEYEREGKVNESRNKN